MNSTCLELPAGDVEANALVLDAPWHKYWVEMVFWAAFEVSAGVAHFQWPSSSWAPPRLQPGLLTTHTVPAVTRQCENLSVTTAHASLPCVDSYTYGLSNNHFYMRRVQIRRGCAIQQVLGAEASLASE